MGAYSRCHIQIFFLQIDFIHFYMFPLFSAMRQFTISTSSNDTRRKLISAYDRLLDKLHNSKIPADAHYKKALSELLTERKKVLTSDTTNYISEADAEMENQKLQDEENILRLMEEEKPWETK